MADTGTLAAFTGVGDPFALGDFDVPDPAPGAAVLKMRLANICGSDMHVWRGTAGGPPPRTLGHEGVGEVLKLGEGVTTDRAGEALHVGDRVVFAYFHPCLECPTCLKGHTNACPYRYEGRTNSPEQWPHFTGTFGQYYYLFPRHTMFKVPDHLSDRMVAGINCALSQVIAGLRQADASLGDTVALQGAGGLGVYAAAVAKARGAAKVIAIDGVDERLELIKAFGADAIVDMREYNSAEARAARVRELTGGLGADVTLELVGHAAVLPEGLAMTAPGGRYLEIGNINVGPRTEIDPSILVFRSITLMGVIHYLPRDLEDALQFVSRNTDRLPFDRVLSHTFPLREIDAAFREQDAGHVTRGALVAHP